MQIYWNKRKRLHKKRINSHRTDHFRYIKIHTWFRGSGEQNKRNVYLFIAEPQDDLVSFIPPSLAAKYEF